MSEVATPTTPEQNLRWYQGIPRYAWMVLIICALGWMFDTMDQHLFNLVRSNSVRDLLAGHVPPDKLGDIANDVGAQITAVFLLGWAFGGFVFGMVGDRLGRARTMVLTILTYAAFTGLNALVQTPWQYALCRFLTAMGVGGEFAAGASLVAEVWPERSRTMALGLVQALSAVGNMSAAIITLTLSAFSWRYVFIVGAIPAILVIWIQLSVREPEKWQAARDKAKEAGGKSVGSISQIFADPVLRRNTIAGMLLAIAGVGGFWGVGVWFMDLIGSAFTPIVNARPEIAILTGDAHKQAVNAALQVYKSKAFFLQNIGAFLGMFGFAPLSNRIGRRPAMFMVFVTAFCAIQATFWFVRDPTTAYLFACPLGFFALAPFAAFAVYFPELYPTRVRATGVGFCYNCARVVAAAFSLWLGKLALTLADPADPTAGLRRAAAIVACVYIIGLIGLTFAPETRGKPLPE